MIAGFDPGTVSALAVLDLKGKVLLLESFRGGLVHAVELLRKHGGPSLVASDRKDSDAVRKLAASFGAVAFFPEADLGVEEKRLLVRGYDAKDQHQKDALAAAINAYKKHSRLIDKVMSREKEIFDKLVKGDLPNIAQALEEEDDAVRKRRRKKKFELERRVRDLERRLKMAEKVLEARSEEVEELKKRKGGGKTRVRIPTDARMERAARQRLERELTEAHDRISKMELELELLKKSKEPAEKENIRQRVLRMIREYKGRFRK